MFLFVQSQGDMAMTTQTIGQENIAIGELGRFSGTHSTPMTGGDVHVSSGSPCSGEVIGSDSSIQGGIGSSGSSRSVDAPLAQTSLGTGNGCGGGGSDGSSSSKSSK